MHNGCPGGTKRLLPQPSSFPMFSCLSFCLYTLHGLPLVQGAFMLVLALVYAYFSVCVAASRSLPRRHTPLAHLAHTHTASTSHPHKHAQGHIRTRAPPWCTSHTHTHCKQSPAGMRIAQQGRLRAFCTLLGLRRPAWPRAPYLVWGLRRWRCCTLLPALPAGMARAHVVLRHTSVGYVPLCYRVSARYHPPGIYRMPLDAIHLV